MNNLIKLDNIISQVKRNCNISDAKFWGEYSICGLLLRLRELYRCEKGLKLWERIPHEDISEWMSEKENIWKELQNKELENIIIAGSEFGPFEVSDINKKLETENLIYGAGYGIYMKPSFFLAELVSKRKIDGYEVYISGNEYARDLADYPAMLQDSIIFARIDTTKLRLWERFEELSVRDPRSPLSYAFSRYGINHGDKPSADIDNKFSLTALSEIETFIYHELGEAIEDENLGEEWKELILELSGRKAEFFSRAIKDLLADTTEKGMINYIIKNQKEGSLGFYIVFLDGYRKLLFPEIINAFGRFIDTGDWELIEDARIEGYKKAKGYAERLLSIKREISDRAQLLEYIEKEIVDRRKAINF